VVVGHTASIVNSTPGGRKKEGVTIVEGEHTGPLRKGKLNLTEDTRKHTVYGKRVYMCALCKIPYQGGPLMVSQGRSKAGHEPGKLHDALGNTLHAECVKG